jgi:L-2-hydroxyglutarate oxidase LhgO
MLQLNQLSFWERNAFFDSIDFTIIGAGIVGYTTAIHIKEKYPNARVLILEKGYLPSGASSKNAGFTCFGSPTEIFDDLQNNPEDNVWQTIKMRYEGLQELFRLMHGKDIGYEKNGSWDLILQNDFNSNIDGQFIEYLNEKCFGEFGLKNIYKEDLLAPDNFNFQSVKTSYYNAEEGQIDTGKLIRTLHELATAKGVISLFGIELIHFKDESNGVRLNLNMGEFQTSKLIVCTSLLLNLILNRPFLYER